MKFLVGCELDYAVTPPTTLFLNVRVKPTRGLRLISERMELTPSTGLDSVSEGVEESRFDCISAREAGELLIRYRADVSIRHRLIPIKKLQKALQPQFDGSMLPWLYPSRYCQSDLLGRLAQQKFGRLRNTFDQVRAIADWIYSHVDYQRGETTSAVSARDTLTECAGVCRDFAHLGIALCRALSIPARYVTGYAFQLEPPDFHACFEAWIGGVWILFDATRLAPMNGLVPIGIGRDASEASFSSCFGDGSLKRIAVSCKAATGFKPVMHDADVAVSFDPLPK